MKIHDILEDVTPFRNPKEEKEKEQRRKKHKDTVSALRDVVAEFKRSQIKRVK